MDLTTQQQHLHHALEATNRASSLAREAELAARGNDPRYSAPALAAAGTLWASVARAHAAIAAALPEQTEETAHA